MPSSTIPSSREFVTQLLNSLRGTPQASADITNTAASNPLQNAPEPVKKQLLALHVLFPNELLPALDLLDRRLVTRFRIRYDDDNVKDTTTQGAHVDTFTSTNTLRGHDRGEGAAAAPALLHDEHTRPSGPTSISNHALTGAVGRMDSSDAEMMDAPQTIREEGLMTQDPTEETEDQIQDKEVNTIYYVRSAQQRSSRYSTSYDSITSYEVRLKAWNCSCPAFAFSAFPSVHPEPPVPTYDPKTIETGEQEGAWSFGGLSLGDGTPPVCKHLLACVLAERCSAWFGGFVEEKEVSVDEAAGWAAGWGD